MIEEVMSAYGGRLVVAILGVGIGLVCLIGILWIMRGRSGPSPFVRGGRNRQPRLQVLDAAAVDARRRLVLVRRDDVEHLIMIGGPTDIVIESGISGQASTRAALEAPSAAPAAQVSETRGQPLPRTAITSAENRAQNSRDIVTREPQRSVAATPAAPQRSEPVAGRSAAIAGPMPVATQAEIAPAPQATMPAREQKTETRSPAPGPALAAAIPAARSAALPLAAASLAVDEAANALDAARSRVFVERPEPEPPLIVPINAATVPASLQPAAEKPKMLGSDFEKILEEEMASNLAAREATTIPQPNRQTPPRDPAISPVTGATADPSLQDEVARIFGEMSATRDK
ncbi:flagellar biosynthesis protein FliO [Rhizobium deserti]|uniref:Flagellar biosynthesis protein FliO n=1 Tax=Rhizobium deserti TaxID=2547961 RepID=A0A4R5UIL0_9HYPH|nr:flagellar biosynthetic protein FliO [Rhizobium deserti]TDK36661.1 flagellar biosynthesis protein FliO [Rhizobium deserti]